MKIHDRLTLKRGCLHNGGGAEGRRRSVLSSSESPRSSIAWERVHTTHYTLDRRYKIQILELKFEVWKYVNMQNNRLYLWEKHSLCRRILHSKMGKWYDSSSDWTDWLLALDLFSVEFLICCSRPCNIAKFVKGNYISDLILLYNSIIILLWRDERKKMLYSFPFCKLHPKLYRDHIN